MKKELKIIKTSKYEIQIFINSIILQKEIPIESIKLVLGQTSEFSNIVIQKINTQKNQSYIIVLVKKYQKFKIKIAFIIISSI